jgi:hypothetical protein
MGGKLGTLFAHAGHEVVFSYARSKETGSHARLVATRDILSRSRCSSPTSRMEEQKAQNWHTASRDPFARTELRKRAQVGLNKGEARNGLARAFFFSLTAKNCSRSIAIFGRCTDYGRHSSLCALASRSFRLVSLLLSTEVH